MQDRQHQHRVEMPARPFEKTGALAVAPAEAAGGPREIHHQWQDVPPLLPRPPPERARAGGVGVDGHDPRAGLRRQRAEMAGVRADIEHAAGPGLRQGVAHKCLLQLESFVAVAVRLHVARPDGTGRRRGFESVQPSPQASEQGPHDEARLFRIAQSPRGVNGLAAALSFARQPRRQRDQAKEWRADFLPRPAAPVHLLRRQPIAPGREHIGQRDAPRPMRQQRQQKRADELRVGFPHRITRRPPLERQEIDEDRLAAAEQHVPRRRILEREVFVQRRFGEIEREPSRRVQHFRRPFVRETGERHALMLEHRADVPPRRRRQE